MITLTVNGEARHLDTPARTHLADALRDGCGLTGTHIGCEQGVCGACTVLVEGKPTRSCLLYAHEAAGKTVTTIEGLDDDPVAEALRDAFSRHHALQCGYCTPGMMVTARDIVLRLGAVDEERIREELAGNLCRCTGYRGIVRAIAEVAANRPVLPAAAPRREAPAVAALMLATVAPAVELPNRIEHQEALAVPLEAAWAILSDPARIAACLPGAALTRHEGAVLEGTFTASLGPISASFAGVGEWAVGDHAGSVRGRGRDGANAAEGQVEFHLTPAPEGALLDVVLSWRLTGPLAQFSRPALLRGLVAGLAGQFARNLERAARGEAPAQRLSLWALIRAWIFGR